MSTEKKANKITVQSGFEFDESGHLITRDTDLHIVVDGSLFSGKSTFIQTVTQNSLYPWHGYGNTFLGFGQIRINSNSSLYLHEPHQLLSRFWKEIEQVDLLGFIVLLRGDDSSEFREARAVLTHAEMYHIPCVVASNPYKHGISTEGWAIDDLRIALRLDKDVTIMSCDVKDKESVKNVLLTLLYKVLDEIEAAEKSKDEIK